jgi:hypothetical protein
MLMASSNFVGRSTGSGRPGALEDLVHEGPRASVLVCTIRPVGHQATGIHEWPHGIDRRQPVLAGKTHAHRYSMKTFDPST